MTNSSTQSSEQLGQKGFAAVVGGFANLGRNAQAIAGEFVKMSEENLVAGTKAMEKLREAKNFHDISTIQMDLITKSYETSGTHYKQIAALAGAVPGELAKNYQAFFSNFAEASGEANRKASEMARSMGEQVAKSTLEAANVTQRASR
jgi:hypothetical protein